MSSFDALGVSIGYWFCCLCTCVVASDKEFAWGLGFVTFL